MIDSKKVTVTLSKEAGSFTNGGAIAMTFQRSSGIFFYCFTFVPLIRGSLTYPILQ